MSIPRSILSRASTENFTSFAVISFLLKLCCFTVGPGGRDESGKLVPIDVKVGDRVLFGKWSGTEVKLDGVEYLIMKESDLMGVLVEAEGRQESRLTPQHLSSVPKKACP